MTAGGLSKRLIAVADVFVRHLPGGFAVEFVQSQDARSLERMIIQPPR